jgi:hypothetical protein
MAPRPDRLTSIQIAERFAVANEIRGNTSESERREAVAELLSEFQAQCQHAQREIEDHQVALAAAVTTTAAWTAAELDALGQGPLIDRLLVQGIKNWGFRILSQPDPIAALEKLLGTRRRRGKRAKNTERDFWIAVAVAEKMNSGTTLEKASFEVAETSGLEAGNVNKIYTRNLVEAKAQVALMEIDKLGAQEATAAGSAEDLQTGSRQSNAAKETLNSDHAGSDPET